MQRRWWMIGGLALLMLIPFSPDPAAYGQDAVTLTVSQLTVPVGGPGVIVASATCPAVCNEFTIELHFDPTIISVDAAFVGSYLGPGARVGQNSTDNINGSVRLHALAAAPPLPGATGEVLLLNITGLTDGITPLEVAVLEVLGPDGTALSATGFAGAVVVGNGGAPPVGEVGQIALVSERDGNREIYLTVSDGSQVQRLTNNPAADEFPAWSPDGTRLAFVSDRNGSPDIWVMNADGSDPHPLTNDPAADTFPVWSPDGTQIAFVSDRGGTDAIMIMQADGSNPVALTDETANNTTPTWAPDGGQIAFVSDRDGNHEIYMMAADGSAQTRITTVFAANMWYPSWSPDGALLAVTYEGGGQAEYFVMAPDGSNVRPINVPGGWLGRLTWSPDSTQVSFVGLLDGTPQVFITNLTDPAPRPLANLLAGDFAPNWRPAPVVREPSPAPEEAPSVSAPAVACTIWTDAADVAVRVGPGTQRSIFTFLLPGDPIDVIGQNTDASDTLWWQVDKTALTDNPTVNSLWVAAADVNSEGDCASVAQADASPVIAAPATNNNSTAATGEWGECGSCSVCSGPASECQTNPAGECVWNPQLCGPVVAAPPSGSSGSSGGGSGGGSSSEPPVASFTWVTNFGVCNQVLFTNTSTNANSAVWDFGNGGGTTPAPGSSDVHTYPYRTGVWSYTVTLEAIGPGGNDTTQQVVKVACGF